jgi:hypothetical protein
MISFNVVILNVVNFAAKLRHPVSPIEIPFRRTLIGWLISLKVRHGP